jgi:hypothetical protein
MKVSRSGWCRRPAAAATGRARLNGSALSAELLPIQKMAPCGWPGLKPRKLPRPPPPPPKPPARQTTAAEAASTAEAAAAAEVSSARPAALRAQRLHRIADAVHIQAGQRTHRSRLAADGHRIAAEVGVAGNRGQRRARRAGWPAWLSVSAASALIRLRFCAPFAASCRIA